MTRPAFQPLCWRTRRDRSGASLPDYAIIVGLISVLSIAAVSALGVRVEGVFADANTEIALDGTGSGTGSGGDSGGSGGDGDDDETPGPSAFQALFSHRQFGNAEIASATIDVTGASAGDSYSLVIASSGGGSPFTSTGTFSGASAQVGPFDLSGLPLGDVTLTLTAFDDETSDESGSATDQASYTGGDAYPDNFNDEIIPDVAPDGGYLVYIDTSGTDVPLDSHVDTPGAYFCEWDIDYANCNDIGTDTVFNPGDEAYVFIPTGDDFEVTTETVVTVGSRRTTITAVTRAARAWVIFRDGGNSDEDHCESGSPISAAQLNDTCYFGKYALDGTIDPGLSVDWDVVWFNQADWAPTIVVGSGSPMGRYCDAGGCGAWATSGQLTGADGWMEFRIETNGTPSPSSNPNWVSGSWSMFSPRIYDTDGNVVSEIGPGARNRP